MQIKLTFKPKTITKSLLSELQTRGREIIERRYGLLNGGTERMTLEAIGEIYGITRERVRQIENTAIETIRKSKAYKNALSAIEELEDAMVAFGGIVREEDFLNTLAKDTSTQNHIHFLLIIGEPFIKLKEDEDFHHRWTVDPELSEKVHEALRNLYKNLDENDLITETEMIFKFIDHLRDTVEEVKDEELAKRYLRISKRVRQNRLGDWGLSHSPNVKTRGMRDMAYLILKKKGTPLHFTEVAKLIAKEFGRKAHIATTHNELIKDGRFVLVGRGLYALSEWGYSSGVVRDVIRDVLKKNGPLSKNDVVEEVLKQRHVKENTIYVNLQNSNYFKKDQTGKYSLA